MPIYKEKPWRLCIELGGTVTIVPAARHDNSVAACLGKPRVAAGAVYHGMDIPSDPILPKANVSCHGLNSVVCMNSHLPIL